MKYRWLCMLSSSLALTSAACGDADGGLSEVALPDAEVSETADAAGDVAGPDGDDGDDRDDGDDGATPGDGAIETSDDTGTPDVAGDVAEVEPDTSVEPADTAEDTAPDETAEDTSADDSAPGDTDVVTPQCTTDLDCPAVAGIVPPLNECVVPRCIDNVCTMGDRDCGDTDPCTLDACDPRTGCVNTEVIVDSGASRYWYCPEAMLEADAAAACVLRGQALAIVDDARDALALAPLLGDAGAPKAWTSSASVVTCPAPRRIVPLQCKSLSWAAEATCTEVSDCAEALPFICEARCDDGDPCTDDVVGADGKCETKVTICDDNDACTTDSCWQGVGCVFDRPRGQCIDANPCTTDSCDPATGVCSNKPVREGWDATHELLRCPGQDTWAAARTWCAVNGGVLAMPTTDAQKATLAAFAGALGVSGLWAPLEQAGGGANPWSWVDAGGSGTPPWCAGQPDDAAGSEDCGEWVPGQGCLGDVICSDMRSFGCAIDTTIP